MTFGYPSNLWLLLAIPPAMMLFFWWSARERQKLMTQFIQARLLPGLIKGISTTREKTRAALLIAAAACLIVTLAEPRWGYDMEEVTQRGLDIVVAVDTSKSMLTADIAPSRLARAKLAALDLMKAAKSDRLGLVAFAGSAFLQCPLTVDDVVFRQSVETLDVHTIPDGGTVLAEAIETAARAFKEGDNYKVLVLMTDGEDLESGALDAAKKAAEGGLRIFTVGIGTAEGDFPRITDAKGNSDFVRDEQGNVVKSHLNESLLQQIAGAAKGFYLPLRGADPIDVLYEKGLAPLPKSESKEKWVKRLRDHYHWPLVLALVFLIAEMLFPERKNARKVRNPALTRSGPPESGTPNRFAVSTTTVLALLVAATSGLASPAGALREYKAGNYDGALKEYQRSLRKDGTNADPRLYFNAGAAAYREQGFDRALQYFTNALTAPAPDITLQQQSYYNLGNTLYKLGESSPDPQKKNESWESAVKQYERAIKLNTNDADAKFNYSFVTNKLEQLKQQQQQQQNSKQDKSKQNQDQQQQNQNSQSKDDKEKRNSSSQEQQQRQQDQKQDSSRQQQAEDQKQAAEKEQQQQQQAKQAEEQKKQDPSDQEKKDSESNREARAAGQMTPQEARRLLDSQKDDELTMPISRKDQSSEPRRSGKDW